MASASEPREECVQTIRSEIPQKTIHQSFCVQGVGLHHGGRVKVTVHPARENQGIFFRVFQNDSWVLVPARSHFVSSSTRCTMLASGVGSLSTVEHFLAACWGADVDNLEVVVEGEEMPAGDGSSVFWMDYFTQSGIVEQASPRWYLVVNDWICIQDRNQYLFAFPGPSFSVSYFLDVFENPSFAEYAFFSGNQEFFSTIAAARTFAFQNDVDTILREGLGQGV
ncbi:MAG: UDP-3-O-acyl-N-acetylglucosamine deacetylase, partial [Atribacterota bacterium]